MRCARFIAFGLLLSAFTALGQEPEAEPPQVQQGAEEEEEESSPARYEFKGFFDSRYYFSRDAAVFAFSGLMPQLPDERAFFEANIDPSVRKEHFTLAGDFSIYAATYAPYYLLLINEAYVELQAGAWRLHLGRQRMVWGSGLAINPTDILNPPKNPLDIQQQRTGTFYLPMLEFNQRYFSANIFLSPYLTTDPHAIPVGLDFTKPWLGARAYFNVLETDLNLVGLRDTKGAVTYFGGSVSRFVAERLELHLEAMFAYRPKDFLLLPPLVQAGMSFCDETRYPKKVVSPTIVGGGRYDWSDQSFLSLEYFFNYGGISTTRYDNMLERLGCIRQVAESGRVPEFEYPNPVGHPIDPTILLVRQHYLIASYQRPHLNGDTFSDVLVSSSVVFGPQDQSAVVQLKAGYNFADRASFFLTAVAWLTRPDSELDLFPNRWLLTSTFHVSY